METNELVLQLSHFFMHDQFYLPSYIAYCNILATSALYCKR